jgi:hypothetical protein
MNVVADKLLIDLDHAMQAARNRLDAIELPAHLDVAENFAFVDDEGDKRIPRPGAFSGPDEAASFRRIDVGAFSGHADSGKQIDGHRRRQPAGSLKSVRSLIGGGRKNAR